MFNIICFLTVNPCELFYNFCKKLKNNQYDVYICIDDNNYNIPNYDNEINIVKLDNELCEASGFKNTVSYCKGKACSRDKALYYFCRNDIEYDYIWFIEQDVFIPNEFTIINIDNKYNTGDLLSQTNIIMNQYNNKWSHWNRVKKECKFMLPYFLSMVCAIRCSKKLLSCINNYCLKYNNLFFCEVLFNTIAYKNDLEIITPAELSTIIYRANWSKDDIKECNLYHPIKDINIQYEYRM